MTPRGGAATQSRRRHREPPEIAQVAADQTSPLSEGEPPRATAAPGKALWTSPDAAAPRQKRALRRGLDAVEVIAKASPVDPSPYRGRVEISLVGPGVVLSFKRTPSTRRRRAASPDSPRPAPAAAPRRVSGLSASRPRGGAATRPQRCQNDQPFVSYEIGRARRYLDRLDRLPRNGTPFLVPVPLNTSVTEHTRLPSRGPRRSPPEGSSSRALAFDFSNSLL